MSQTPEQPPDSPEQKTSDASLQTEEPVFTITEVKDGLDTPREIEKEDLLTDDSEEEEDDNSTILDDVLNGRDLNTVPLHDFKDLVSQLVYYEADCREAFDEEGVATSRRLNKEINANYKQRSQKAAYKEYKEKVNLSLSEALNKVDNVNGRYERTLAALHRKQSNDMEKLQQKNQSELERFDEEWQSSTKMRRFARASPQLRELRNIRINYAMRGEVQNEREAKKAEDELELRDTQLKTQKMRLQYEEDRKNLIDKHRKQEEVMNLAHEGELNSLNKAYREQLSVAERRVQNIRNTLNSSTVDSVWNRHHRKEKQTVGRPIKSVRVRSTSTNVNTWSLSLPPLSSQKKIRARTPLRRPTTPKFK